MANCIARCNTCRWWEQYDGGVPAGECRRIDREDQTYPYIDMGVTDYVVLVTNAEFGCTEHAL